MSNQKFTGFFGKFGVDVSAPNPQFNFSSLVCGNIVKSFPFEVAKILTVPRGPTSAQEGLVGVIIPYMKENELIGIANKVTGRQAQGGSYNMKTGESTQSTKETLIVSATSFVNAVLLACYHHFSIGDTQTATKMMIYINEIMPYAHGAGLWTLSPMNDSGNNAFTQVGNIHTDEQLRDPYAHKNDIFQGQ